MIASPPRPPQEAREIELVDALNEYRDAVRVHARTPDKYNLNQMEEAGTALLSHMRTEREGRLKAEKELDQLRNSSGIGTAG